MMGGELQWARSANRWEASQGQAVKRGGRERRMLAEVMVAIMTSRYRETLLVPGTAEQPAHIIRD